MSTELNVMVNKELVGVLVKESDEFVFSYLDNIDTHSFISLTMPVRRKDYTHHQLLPIFEMHLPEGYLLSVIKKQFSKLTKTDDFGILQLTGPNIRGRVEYGDQIEEVDDAIELNQLLHQSDTALFDELVEKFALRSALSGVQPKVIAGVENKATLQLEDYIVKAWGNDYPELALNEYCCMLACKHAGIQVPEFYLSDDHALFIMKRFDLSECGVALGFEDMCVLQAKQRDDKYSGSYEQIAKTIKTFVSMQHKNDSLEQFFKMIVINNVLQNGDAHLKNFGLIYENVNSIRLSPVYDVISTTVYIKQDIAALTLMGSKKWWHRPHLERFAVQVCELSPYRAKQLFDECLTGLFAANDYINSRLASGMTDPSSLVLAHIASLIESALEP